MGAQAPIREIGHEVVDGERRQEIQTGGLAGGGRAGCRRPACDDARVTWVPHKCVAAGCAVCLGLSAIRGDHHDHGPEEPSPIFPAMGSREVNQARGTATMAHRAVYVPLSKSDQRYLASLQEISFAADQTGALRAVVKAGPDRH
jgi:hypothetical protein